ncbi:hypothetical protein [Aliikangiella sp. G2MR2-5]|uniref:hypothetical protein n=1 Tax=Aliikangiella sp. G2MR2-5 TaxID=2788943 RepID=UPI0018A8EB23|nr:hypothetical protein [Aliikangiella sp. G2MR2-5]
MSRFCTQILYRSEIFTCLNIVVVRLKEQPVCPKLRGIGLPGHSIQFEHTLEEELLSVIREQERLSMQDNNCQLSSRYYFQLADFYHCAKDYDKEAAILSRYARLDSIAGDELIQVYDRIERALKLYDIKVSGRLESSHLTLVSEDEPVGKFTIGSGSKTHFRVNPSLTPFSQKNHRVLTVCSAYTGRSDDDEIAQIALVLFEFNSESSEASRVLDTYVANRTTRKSIPTKTAMQFALVDKSTKRSVLDSAKILSLFELADFVVSHNDAEIERKLISLHFPQVADKPWYSSQKDIPWGALGYENKSLSTLARAHGEKAARTCLERASAICKLVQKFEPSAERTYLERLYHMTPMRPMVWTPELLKRSKNLTTNSSFTIARILALLIGGSAIVTCGCYFITWPI